MTRTVRGELSSILYLLAANHLDVTAELPIAYNLKLRASE